MTVVDVQLLRVGDLSGGDRRSRVDDLSRVVARLLCDGVREAAAASSVVSSLFREPGSSSYLGLTAPQSTSTRLFPASCPGRCAKTRPVTARRTSNFGSKTRDSHYR
jgi:hypothetical protein